MKISEIIEPYKNKVLTLTQIKQISSLLTKLPEKELISYQNFYQSFEYQTKSFLGYNQRSVHLTSLFMMNTKIFKKMLDENSTFVDAFSQANKMTENNNNHTPFYFLPMLEKKVPELVKSLIERKLPIDLEKAFFDIDDVYKSVNLFKKTGINIVEAFCQINNIVISEQLSSYLDFSYLKKNSTNDKNKNFLSSILGNELERQKIIYPSHDYEHEKKSASFVENFEIFKKMMGNIQLMTLTPNSDQSQYNMHISNSEDIIIQAEHNAGTSFAKLAAQLDKNFIDSKIDSVIKNSSNSFPDNEIPILSEKNFKL